MEHLNHHGNLYAGQGIEWMIETSFIVVCTEYGDPQGLLYKNTHKFDFYKSIDPGDEEEQKWRDEAESFFGYFS